MADKSPIEWTDATWNPIVGCSIVSPGCTHCYAMRMAGRIEAMGGAKHYAGTTKKVNGNTVWTGEVAMAPDHILLQPLAWRAPRHIFVNSMGDLFHEDVPDEWIDRALAVMALAKQHTFQVLTKRATRMREYLSSPGTAHRIYTLVCEMTVELEPGIVLIATPQPEQNAPPGPRVCLDQWPIPNVWLGVSAERQQEANERIPQLLMTPAAKRFVSAEPLLGPVDFTDLEYGDGIFNALTPDSWENMWDSQWKGTTGDPDDELEGFLDWYNLSAMPSGPSYPGLDWIIAGGESGPNARPMHPAWVRSIRDQCQAAGVPFFFKQWGAWAPGEWSLDLHDHCQFTPLDPAVPVHGLADHDRAQHRVHWWDDDKVPEGLGSLRLDKKAAGRLLDGVEHNGMPGPNEVPAL